MSSLRMFDAGTSVVMRSCSRSGCASTIPETARSDARFCGPQCRRESSRERYEPARRSKRGPSGKQRVLRKLRQGPVPATAFDAGVVTDGPPIRRLAARVCELRKDGYQIETRRAKGGVAVYILVGGPGPHF